MGALHDAHKWTGGKLFGSLLWNPFLLALDAAIAALAPLNHSHAEPGGEVAQTFGTAAERAALAPTAPLKFDETDTGLAWAYLGGDPYDAAAWYCRGLATGDIFQAGDAGAVVVINDTLDGMTKRTQLGQYLVGQAGSETVSGASAGVITPGTVWTTLHQGSAGNIYLVTPKMAHNYTADLTAQFRDNELGAAIKFAAIPPADGNYIPGTFLLEGDQELQAYAETADLSFWARVIKNPVGYKPLSAKTGTSFLSMAPTVSTVVHTTTAPWEMVAIFGCVIDGGENDTLVAGAGALELLADDRPDGTLIGPLPAGTDISLNAGVDSNVAYWGAGLEVANA